ncbi:MAG: 4Fe-4S binding protein [Firmicutes bacterium]|nr:4Fe-4S binding protein [Bacillota bacterium]
MDIFAASAVIALGLGMIISLVLIIGSAAAKSKASPDTAPEASAEESAAPLQRAAVTACTGIDQICEKKMDYQGPASCAAAAALFGGPLSCAWSCLGGGDCVNACPKKAISLRNGLAVVEPSLCDGCGKCLDTCPKGLLKLIPKGRAYVGCSHRSEGPAPQEGLCEAGCDGCGLCTVVCPRGAIHSDSRLAVIDSEACDGCGLCVRSCPRHIIRIL